MLDSSRDRILDRLTDGDLCLDVGGGASPFARADWVMDLVSYDERVPMGDERFGPSTWIQRDVCDREPFPFADDSVAFAVCSHTLEDIRDPIWVCSELSRVARAGYIEVPSRIVEQSPGVHGPWTGWSHHRWLVDIDPDRDGIDFVFKSAVVHARPSATFGSGTAQTLTPDEQVQQLWWTGRIEARERILLTAEDLDAYLDDFVAATPVPTPHRASLPSRALARLIGRN